MSDLRQANKALLDDLVSLRETMRIPYAEIVVYLGAPSAPTLALNYEGNVVFCWRGYKLSLGNMGELGFSHFDQEVKEHLESEIGALREQAKEETFVWARIAASEKATVSS